MDKYIFRPALTILYKKSKVAIQNYYFTIFRQKNTGTKRISNIMNKTKAIAETIRNGIYGR